MDELGECHDRKPATPPDGAMLAMRLEEIGRPLRAVRVPIPVPGEHDILIRVSVCGVCRTDLHIADGELPPPRLPLIPGHEAVGRIVQLGRQAGAFMVGERVGVPWLGGCCGCCRFCGERRENLCDAATFTGYNRDGGYAEYMIADARFAFRIPERYDDLHAAPLLCAGLIGYRAYAMIAKAECIGLYGFGAAAHIVAQVALHQGKQVFAFTRPGDTGSQEFARSLGAMWAGDSTAAAPALLDAAIIFAPVGSLVPQALAATGKGASVICAGIHMSDIPAFRYDLLWGERSLRSVANLTRADGEAFFKLSEQIALRTTPVPFPMQAANLALEALRNGAFDGAAVLVNEPSAVTHK